MKRVLQVLGTTNLGGAESRIMDLYRHMNREEIQFDFLVHSGKKGFFDEEIRRLGGKIYYLPSFRVYNYFSYKKACRLFFAEHPDYAAVHGHMTSTASIYLPEAKKAGIPLTIAHARSAGVDKGIKGTLTKLLRKNLYKKCDKMLACSDLAAKAVFGEKCYQENKVTILPNAIDTREYLPNDQIRNQIRREYQIEDKFVIGHVGRFHYAKNHEFLVEIFAELLKQKANAVLMLLGDGPLRGEIEEKAKRLGVYDKIIFAGNQTPAAPFYQAFDYFLFPSRFEGMPGTVVEAQAAGLKCLISDSVTKQVKATELVTFLSLEQPAKVWADEMIRQTSEVAEGNGNRNPVAECCNLASTNYDVNNQVRFYEELYKGGR